MIPFGIEVRASEFLAPGTMVLVGPRNAVYVRHLAELTPSLAGVRWHVHGERCPTWTDATECRCMLGGEA